MKLLIQFIALFCCQFIFAQGSANISEQKLKQDSTNLCFYHSEKSLLDSTSVANKTKGIGATKKCPDTETSIAIQNIDIIKEINAVLNYKINRIWRRDLYCLVCENFDAGKAA
ncbi:MAG: hypothetical protein K0R77_3314 [Chryseobacterium sp.]|jgi:hypothetical protein|uniref:hypothetical protein n=1 Tax=Chryseobacterium sp. TaxID=1871047 RepID=UPI002616DC09|nr:hypothetical protein [Chryseobacterium sp.]MDF2554039.1 hypothetical protein [Chryseobacterium sp.]